MCWGRVEGFQSTMEEAASNEKSRREGNNSDSDSQKHSGYTEYRKREEAEEKGGTQREGHLSLEKNGHQSDRT